MIFVMSALWHHAAMTPALMVQFALCPIVLLSLLRQTAPYGRHYQAGWGPVLPNRLAWLIMEIPALLTITAVVVAHHASATRVTWLALAFWLAHYGYRTVLFPLWMRPSDKTFPVLLVGFAVAFNVLNGWNNALALVPGTQDWPPPAHFSVGAAVFACGFAIHTHSDTMIRNLRSRGERSYAIPRGGLFRWVSNPNYLGEIVQWTGWAIMTWSLAGLAFALFTACNLVPRARSNHDWYRREFADYPPDRRIIVPGIY